MAFSASYLTGYRGTERVVVIEPTGDRWDRSTRVPVLFVHGGGGTGVEHLAQMPSVAPALDLFAQAGATVFSADFGGPWTWGNPDLRDSFDQIIPWAADRFWTRTDRVGIVGVSHGAGSACWAWRNHPKVAAMALVIPEASLVGLHTRDPFGAAAGIESAFAPFYPTWQDALPDHDLIANTGPLSVLRDRTRVFYHDNDPITLPAEVLAVADGARLPRTNLGSYGHQITFDWSPVVDWTMATIRANS